MEPWVRKSVTIFSSKLLLNQIKRLLLYNQTFSPKQVLACTISDSSLIHCAATEGLMDKLACWNPKEENIQKLKLNQRTELKK